MKLQDIIILSIREFRNYFEFNDFWQNRKAFCDYWRKPGIKERFTTDRFDHDMLSIICKWISGEDFDYKVTKTGEGYSLSYDWTECLLPHYALYKSKIDRLGKESRLTQIGAVALCELLMHKNDDKHYIGRVFDPLFAMSGILNIDMSADVITVCNSNNPIKLQPYEMKDNQPVLLRSVLVANLSKVKGEVELQLRNQKCVLKNGCCCRILFAQNEAIAFLPDKMNKNGFELSLLLKVHGSHYTSSLQIYAYGSKVEKSDIISFDLLPDGSYAYVNQQGVIRCEHHHIDEDQLNELFAWKNEEKPVWVQLDSKGYDCRILTNRGKWYNQSGELKESEVEGLYMIK